MLSLMPNLMSSLVRELLWGGLYVTIYQIYYLSEINELFFHLFITESWEFYLR